MKPLHMACFAPIKCFGFGGGGGVPIATPTRAGRVKIGSGLRVQSDGTTFVDSDEFPVYNTTQYPDFAAVIAAIGSTQATLIVSSPVTLSAPLESPANIAVWVMDNGSINYGANALSILGQFIAPRRHVLIGTGDLFLGYKNLDICPEWVGIEPDTGVDLAAGFTQLNKLLVGKRGGSVTFSTGPEGVYKSSVGYWINGYGIVTRGAGRVIIEPPDGANNYTFMAGNRESGSLSTSIRLTADMLKGATSASVTDASGYQVGGIVFMFSGKSSNSTVNNRIPLYKQIFAIKSIVGNTLNFTSRAEFDFLTNVDDTVTACILAPTATPAVGCTVENIEFRNGSTFTGAYLHGIFYACMLEMKNCKFNAYSSVGYVSFSDHVLYNTCELIGYTGFSAAAGTKRMTIDNCSVNEGLVTQDYAGFFEESPERITVRNTDFYSRVSVGSSSDAAPSKQFIMRDCRIHASGIALRVLGFYNSGGYAIDIDRTEFDAPGALNTASGGTRKSVIDIRFTDGYRITNCEFKNAATDSYAIDVGNVGGLTVNLSGNRYGTSLGPYSTAVDNTNTVPVSHTFTPTLTFGGASTGITYSAQIGTLTEFHDRAEFTITIALTSKGTATGAAVVGGLTFPGKNRATSYQQPVHIAVGNVASSLTQCLQPRVMPNTSTIALYSLNAGVDTALTDSSFTNTTYVLLSGQYEI